MSDEPTTICAGCCEEIPESEVQECHLCGMDGLGNCCIGQHDHECFDKGDE